MGRAEVMLRVADVRGGSCSTNKATISASPTEKMEKELLEAIFEDHFLRPNHC